MNTATRIVGGLAVAVAATLPAGLVAGCQREGLYVDKTAHVEAWITACRIYGAGVAAQVIVQNTDTTARHRYVVTVGVSSDGAKLSVMLGKTTTAVPHSEYALIDLIDNGPLERRANSQTLRCTVDGVGISD